MRKSVFTILTICFVLVISLKGYLRERFLREGKVFEKIEYGEMDWSEGIIMVSGTKSPDEVKQQTKGSDKAKARLIALEQARDLALRNMILAIHYIRIREDVLLKDLIDSGHEEAGKRLEDFISRNIKEKVLYNKDDSITVQQYVHLWGEEGLLFCLQDIMSFGSKDFAVTPQGETGDDLVGQEYTSLIIDAAEMNDLEMSLSPAVLDEKGSVVYDASFVSAENALQSGIVKYIADRSMIPKIEYVDEKAFLAKAKTIKDKTKIVLSDDVVRQLFSSEETFPYLRKCRVIIIAR
ncbi:MAG: hypothetical protein JW827_09450 [Spirochaetes bacterium]|nr:hypothetical protein [Spirochaetota bacterium]